MKIVLAIVCFILAIAVGYVGIGLLRLFLMFDRGWFIYFPIFIIILAFIFLYAAIKNYKSVLEEE